MSTRIVRFVAENVKGLKAIEITPDGSLIELAGENAAGKSSALDAIWLVLGGRQASSEVETPLRNGQKKGFATVDLGDIVATRTWTPTATTLKVTNADGTQVYSSPQSVLDALRAKFLDPGQFIAKDSKAQRQAILDIADLGIDLDAVDRERKKIFEDRRVIGVQGKAIGDVPELVPDVPEAETSASELIARITRRNHLASVQADDIACAEDIRHRIAESESKLAALRAELPAAVARVDKHEALESAETLTGQLAKVEDTNAKVRSNASARAKQVEKDRLRGEYEALTAQIEALDKKRDDAIAKANLPVAGLGFTDDGITLDGVPFGDQASGPKLVAALNIAAAFAPELRVIQMRDGSLLDKKNFKIVHDFAEENDYQIWMETVGEGHGAAIVIEDGRVSA